MAIECVDVKSIFREGKITRYQLLLNISNSDGQQLQARIILCIFVDLLLLTYLHIRQLQATRSRINLQSRCRDIFKKQLYISNICPFNNSLNN
jgi:hypothetical protein